MSDPKKDRAVMRALLDFCGEFDPTDEEVDDDLRAEGVDLPAFLALMEARVSAVKEDERTSRLRAARAKREAQQSRPRSHQYDGLDHAALLAEFARRQEVHASPFHKNFEKMTDDDLRTLLEDQDELDDE